MFSLVWDVDWLHFRLRVSSLVWLQHQLSAPECSICWRRIIQIISHSGRRVGVAFWLLRGQRSDFSCLFWGVHTRACRQTSMLRSLLSSQTSSYWSRSFRRAFFLKSLCSLLTYSGIHLFCITSVRRTKRNKWDFFFNCKIVAKIWIGCANKMLIPYS